MRNANKRERQEKLQRRERQERQQNMKSNVCREILVEVEWKHAEMREKRTCQRKEKQQRNNRKETGCTMNITYPPGTATRGLTFSQSTSGRGDEKRQQHDAN